MNKDNIFRLSCSCGCGDGFEAKAAHGTLYVSFFRSDWYSQQHAFRSSVSDKIRYMKGNRLLREVLVSREDLIAFRDFLKSVVWEEKAEDHKNVSHISPMHLLEEIYAIWLEGDLAEFDVLKGGFHRMFELELSEMERDVLVVKIDKWLKREGWHAIADGESPHVDRITKQMNEDTPPEVVADIVSVDTLLEEVKEEPVSEDTEPSEYKAMEQDVSEDADVSSEPVAEDESEAFVESDSETPDSETADAKLSSEDNDVTCIVDVSEDDMSEDDLEPDSSLEEVSDDEVVEAKDEIESGE